MATERQPQVSLATLRPVAEIGSILKGQAAGTRPVASETWMSILALPFKIEPISGNRRPTGQSQVKPAVAVWDISTDRNPRVGLFFDDVFAGVAAVLEDATQLA